ncbi:hypothetical protein [uncultured Eudoraea sp.]|uniref:hypothetical protein n=1 Tax=uncultured Eudoraea sp. TaxID=1035614 RepID=UPI0026281F81|nr:hypothetical protein [uncultured Eudoraea sp.]
MNYKSILLIPLFFIFLTGCKRGPKTVEPFSIGKKSAVASSTDIIDNEIHEIKILEIIPATKYVYLNVKEDKDQFWIATKKREIDLDSTYFYREALLKTDFKSKIHNRVFDSIWFVTKLVTQMHGAKYTSGGSDNPQISKDKEEPVEVTVHGDKNINYKIYPDISALLNDPDKFDGQAVQIKGKCVKVNNNIMNKNWIHLKDESQDDFDLIITTNMSAQKGDLITIQALVALNKDYGAGYSYDLILENGVILQ